MKKHEWDHSDREGRRKTKFVKNRQSKGINHDFWCTFHLLHRVNQAAPKNTDFSICKTSVSKYLHVAYNTIIKALWYKHLQLYTENLSFFGLYMFGNEEYAHVYSSINK